MDADPPQSDYELAAHFGPDGPVMPARDFLEAITLEGNYLKAWQLCDDNYRLCRAQAWVYNNREHPLFEGVDLGSLVDDLAAMQPTSAWWDSFADIELAGFREAWSQHDATTIGAASRPRPIGLDLELVVFIDTGGEVTVFDGDTLVADALTYTMRREPAGWRVAAVGDRLPEPGWPPTI